MVDMTYLNICKSTNMQNTTSLRKHSCYNKWSLTETDIFNRENQSIHGCWLLGFIIH